MRMVRTVLLVSSVMVAIALQMCTDPERLTRLDRRDAFHTPVGAHCDPLPGGSYTVCAVGAGYCVAAICRAACGGEDNLTCEPRERAVAVDPPSRWPCACVPVKELRANDSLPGDHESGELTPPLRRGAMARAPAMACADR